MGVQGGVLGGDERRSAGGQGGVVGGVHVVGGEGEVHELGAILQPCGLLGVEGGFAEQLQKSAVAHVQQGDVTVALPPLGVDGHAQSLVEGQGLFKIVGCDGDMGVAQALDDGIGHTDGSFLGGEMIYGLIVP